MILIRKTFNGSNLIQGVSKLRYYIIQFRFIRTARVYILELQTTVSLWLPRKQLLLFQVALQKAHGLERNLARVMGRYLGEKRTVDSSGHIYIFIDTHYTHIMGYQRVYLY